MSLADAERLAAIRERVNAALATEEPPFRTHFSEDDFSGDSSNLDDVTQWAFDYGAEWGEHSILVGAAAYLLAELDALRVRIEAATAVTDEYDEGGDRKPGHEECAGDDPCEACWLNEEYRAALAGVQPEAAPLNSCGRGICALNDGHSGRCTT